MARTQETNQGCNLDRKVRTNSNLVVVRTPPPQETPEITCWQAGVRLRQGEGTNDHASRGGELVQLWATFNQSGLLWGIVVRHICWATWRSMKLSRGHKCRARIWSGVQGMPSFSTGTSAGPVVLAV